MIYSLRHLLCSDDGGETPVIVRYNYSASCLGSRERGTGLPLEPDEPEDIEITEVTDLCGKTVETSQEQKEILEIECLKDIKKLIEENHIESRLDYGY